MRLRAPRAATLGALLALGAGLSACGSEDPTFTAAEFIEAVNAHGAGIRLGPELTTTDEGKTVHALEFEEPAGEEAGGRKHEHGGGSLIVAEDPETGLAEYERCERTGLLQCLRAANVAVALEGEIGADELARLERAVAALGSQ